jgi:UDP-glucose 4-epimerase
MKVLISGGAGLIGSNLAEKLLNSGHTVCLLDRFSGYKIKYYRSLKLKFPKLILLKADITRFSQIKKVFPDKIDWVFHLAGLSQTKESLENPLLYHQVNVGGTLNILEAVRCNKIKKFIYAASSSCYGQARIFPTPETAPISISSPYALSKYMAEQYVLHYGRVYKLPIISMRLSTVYGQSKVDVHDFGPIFRIFIKQIKLKLPITIRGNGKQSFDFVYVSDVVDAFIKATRSNVCGEIFNVGSGQFYSLNTIGKFIKAQVLYIPKNKHEVTKTQLDIQKIQKLLLWKPLINIEQGIKLLLITV